MPYAYPTFSTLRQGYCEVKDFIEKETAGKVHSLKTKLYADIGCAGDDNLELIEKFIAKYQLDASGFDYSKHFLSEAELFNAPIGLITIISLPVLLFLWIIKVITAGRIDLTIKKIFPGRQTADLTFGDMLTWYLTGKYNLRKDFNFKIKADSTTSR